MKKREALGADYVIKPLSAEDLRKVKKDHNKGRCATLFRARGAVYLSGKYEVAEPGGQLVTLRRNIRPRASFDIRFPLCAALSFSGLLHGTMENSTMSSAPLAWKLIRR